MADKNGDRIDDSKQSPAQLRRKGYLPKPSAEPKKDKDLGPTAQRVGQNWQAGIGALFGQRPQAPKTDLMKFPEGMAGPGKLAPKQADPFSRFDQPRQQVPAEPEMSFADYLQQAMGMLGGGSSSGGGGGVNYDPQRKQLRDNAGQADSRLEAMYRQLRGSIDADAPVIQKGYDDAQASTAAATQTAQAQTQQASDAALSRNDQVLANLGIQQAEGNQIMEGRDLASQTAEAIAGQASKGQAADSRLQAGETAALTHNTNIGNAAGLEGNLQRAANQSKLQQLLAEINMKEQQDNASLAASSSSSGGDFSQMLQLANQMYGFDSDKQERQDNLAIQGAKLAQNDAQAASKVQYDPNKFNAWLAQAVGMENLPEDPYERARAVSYYKGVYTGK
jgi:hypothetical protein